MTALPLFRPANPLNRLWSDAPAFTGLTLLILAATAPILAAMTLDTRLFQDDSVWLKPLKFHLALAIYLATLAFFARYLPPRMTANRRWRLYAAVVCTAIVAELIWIGGAASFATASHFNSASPAMAALYALMGLAAVTLTSASAVMSIAIWRNRATGLPPALHLSIALGLILTFVLTVIVAGTMSSGTGHFIGQPVTGARLPVMGWSREVGDLRAAHFFATHALHGIPLAGWLASRTLAPATATRAVWIAAFGYAAFVLALFAQALAGLPLI
jgi:hypothetical protein